MAASVAAHSDDGVAEHKKQDAPKQQTSSESPSNEYVLNVAFVSFVGFMVLQGFFAIYVAHSQAMLADTEAMAVDSFTYLFNLCAERIKNRPLTAAELAMPQRELDHHMECKRLILELVPPAISVATLTAVTIVTLKEASETLWGVRANDDEDDVSAGYMLLFSGLNLLLDVVNVTCFARAHQAYGLQRPMTVRQLVEQDDCIAVDYKRAMVQAGVDNETTRLLDTADETAYDTGDVDQFQQLKLSGKGGVPALPSLRTSMASRRRGSMTPAVPDIEEDPFFLDSLLGVVNLNMCSAWTHVCADTLRSVAVMVVAAIAFLFEQVPADKADSTAAIAVSILILLSLIPLLRGLLVTARDLVVEYKTYKPVR